MKDKKPLAVGDRCRVKDIEQLEGTVVSDTGIVVEESDAAVKVHHDHWPKDEWYLREQCRRLRPRLAKEAPESAEALAQRYCLENSLPVGGPIGLGDYGDAFLAGYRASEADMTPLDERCFRAGVKEGRRLEREGWLRESAAYPNGLVNNAELRAEITRLQEKLADSERKAAGMVALLKEVKTHCLCDRFGTNGFDYGEKHAKLGKPKGGSRWLTPCDLIDTRMNYFKNEAPSPKQREEAGQ